LRFSLRLCAFAGILCIAAINAQAKVTVTISVVTPGEVRVEAELVTPTRSWSFLNAYAGALGFAERVKEFRATGASGQDAGAKKIASGEFRSERDAARIAYLVDLSSAGVADVPHISWLTSGRGFLMFADLIPRDIENLSAEFNLPSGWMIESSLSPDKHGSYEVFDPEKAVFIVCNSLRQRELAIQRR
jgi:hypothetical protein